VLELMMRGIYDVRRRDGPSWHGTYIPSFMTIDSGIQAILRFCLRNLNGCNVDITDGRIL
jgi:uncharacterized protein YraI